jgi:hypothetical protein
VTQEPEIRLLTAEQLEALTKFASFEIGVAEMLGSLKGIFEIDFETKGKTEDGFILRRTATCHFHLPEPGIVITRAHIANALEKKRMEIISERDLVYWATILLLNDAYVLDPGDEDLIAEWLNDISLHLEGP